MTGFEKLKSMFRNGDSLTRLIMINVVAFMFFWLIEIISAVASPKIYASVVANVVCPVSWSGLLAKFWTLITFPFFESRFISLFCNMLILFWTGRIFLDLLDSKRLIATFALGSLAGVIAGVAVNSLLPSFGFFAGPSAAILAIVAATATYAPKYRLNLAFFGEVSLKAVAIVFVLIEFLPLISKQIPYTHLAFKLGGVIYGFVWASLLKQGTDISVWFVNLCKRVENSQKPKAKFTVSSRRNADETYVSYEEVEPSPKANQAEIDSILDKISRSGYDSLTSEEKQQLFKHNK